MKKTVKRLAKTINGGWPEGEWVKVNSRNLVAVRWGPVMSIEFKNEHVYHYRGVPRRLWLKLMDAASHGEFFHDHVKDKFKYTSGDAP
jgi:hypothetical protein